MSKPSKSRAKKQTKKEPDSEALKALKSAFSKLKKLGLTGSTRVTRAIKETDKFVHGLVEKFKDVLSGAAKALKTPSAKVQREYAQAGYTKAGKRIIVPVSEGEKAYIRHGRVYKKKVTPGVEVVTFVTPVAPKDIEGYLRYVREHPQQFGHLPKGGSWSFTLYGNASYTQFATMDQLVEYLHHYRSIGEIVNEKDLARGQEFIANLQFVTLKKGQQMRENVFNRANATGRSGGPSRSSGKRSMEKARMRDDYKIMKETDPEAYARKIERSKKSVARQRAAKKAQKEG